MYSFKLDGTMIRNSVPILIIIGILVTYKFSKRLSLIVFFISCITHIWVNNSTILFDGYRLGNFIDYEFSKHAFNGLNFRTLMPEICTSYMSELPKQYNDSIAAAFRSIQPLHISKHQLDKLSLLINPCFGHRQWLLYTYDSIKIVYYELRAHIQRAVRIKYKVINPLHACVVHYRVGDFFDTSRGIGSKIMTEKHISYAVKNFECNTIYLLEGGQLHGTPQHIHKSAAFSKKLYNELSKIGKVVRVSGTPDEDFLLMVRADVLITGLGSFAMAAAVANIGQRCTPAIRYLNPNDSPFLYKLHAGHFLKDWMLYDAHN